MLYFRHKAPSPGSYTTSSVSNPGGGAVAAVSEAEIYFCGGPAVCSLDTTVS